MGARVLREGGNAVDAAVATALALAVTYPQAGNLAGGGFMLYADENGKAHFLDYREVAPRNIKAENLTEPDGGRSQRSVVGAMGVAVPGTVAGLAEALQRFGSWPWARVVSTVVDLAEVGVWLTTRQSDFLSKYRENLAQFPSTRTSFGLERANLVPGTLFRQPELARTLRHLAEHGPDDFYKGQIAEQIVTEIGRHGGPLDAEDLAAYRPVWRDPLKIPFAGRDIYTANLPSGGGIILNLSLSLMQNLDISKMAPASPERYVTLARAFRMAFAFRYELAGDPDYLGEPQLRALSRLLEKGLAGADLQSFEQRYYSAKPQGEGSTSACTTHFCVIDSAGRAVSNTYSLNTLFGSKLTVGGAGFLLNNSLDDFRIGESPNWYGLIDGPRNEIAPRRRPVGSMTPTISFGPAGVELVLGGSGGPLIPTMIAQTLIGVLVDGRPLGEAVAAPRVHHQFVRAETQVEDGVPPSAVRSLATLGDPVVPNRRNGIVSALQRDPLTHRVVAVLDPRFAQG